MRIIRKAIAAVLAFAFCVGPAAAQKKYDPGASDTEIKLGQTMPYSGPLSGFITLAKAEIAYFAMINDQGGVNGRKITMISLDDGFSPPKTVEQTRKLVEDDQVLAISGSLGTATNAAIQKYLNQKKVPQLFLASGAARWNDPKNFPYTMTLTPIYTAEASIYAAYVLKEVKDPEGRRALPERRLRQGFHQGLPRAAGRQGRGDHGARGELRGDRRDRRLADDRPRLDQGQRLPQHHDAQIRRAGDPQGARARLEADCSSSTIRPPRSASSCGRPASKRRRASSRRRS